MLSLLPLAFSLHTSAVQQAWVARYAVGSNSQPVAIALDKDSNVYVAGHSMRTNAPYDYDYVLIKYNSLGVQQWAGRYGTAGVNDLLCAMVVTPNSDVFLTGSNATLKYLSTGLLAWSAPYAGRGLAVSTSGECYVTGFSTTDFATVKLDASGSNVWTRTWDLLGRDDRSRVVALDTAGNVLVGGMATYGCDRTQCYQGAYILKYDASGNILWTNVLERRQYSFLTEFNGFACDTQGGAYLALSEWGWSDPWAWRAAKISATGEWLWQNSLNSVPGSSGNGGRAMVVDPYGNLYYSGDSHSYKIAGDATDMWNSAYPGRGTAVAPDGAGDAYVTGQSIGNGTGNDYATIKYGTNGQQLWVQRYTEPGNSDDQARAIAVAPNGDVYVTGFSNPTNGVYQITTIKYVQVAPIEKKSNGNILLNLCGTPGSNYTIQACSTLSNWTNIGSATCNPSGLYTFEDTNAPAHCQRFYRTLRE